MKKKQKFEVAISKVCNLRLTKEYVEIEAFDRQWKVQFGSKTREYAQILYLVSQKEKAGLQDLATLLYQTRAIVTDSLFLGLFIDATKKYFEEIEKKKEIDEKKDAETLAEEKVLHEQTAESIEELEKIKKNEQ